MSEIADFLTCIVDCDQYLASTVVTLTVTFVYWTAD
jgi:hypothetical protein